ncbi:Rgp1-domain-containing protein [Microthyrium microscopicum]|uniref:Rgp1-domain-containing protein n=1 Tax=Microthyrium microscopicum TaxID=703497 RepID=A0A6A6U8B7_9PEZI|nr:Rgp1-domain-containing protein [Microthyrium microscopicum]
MNPSNLRVSVQFTQSAIFAGEDVECIITFTNSALPPGFSSPNHPRLSQRKIPSIPSRKTSAAQRPRLGQLPAPINRVHRSSSIQSSPPSSHRSERTNAHERVNRPSVASGKRAHGRSLSILSLASEAQGDNEKFGAENGVSAHGRRSGRGHGRSASLQTYPNRAPNDSFLAISSNNSSTVPFPKLGTPAITLQEPPLPIRSGRSSNSPANSDANGNIASRRRSPSTLQQEYKFAPSGETENSLDSLSPSDVAELPSDEHNQAPSSRHTTPDRENHLDPAINPASRAISGNSINGGTPRSSVDFYSMSNHSDETLASEYPTQPFIRPPIRGNSVRRTSKLSNVEEHVGPENIMMGYAQVMGNFTLDGSLVNQGPFEEVKRKGVVGGQGAGGVVGLERKKRDSGLFGALGWSNIGESLGGLLNSGELSSIKEMRTKANSKAIPLISTPHSILFVDLQLEPGQSRQYSYKFTLPKGLPPSHKGRAMKVAYTIRVGIQRPGSNSSQNLRSVEIPFRVFGTVNARGDILQHDLLSPHIYLRDLSKTSLITNGTKIKTPPESDLPSFLHYVDALINKQPTRSGLLSPTTPQTPHLRRSSSIAEPATSKEAIDLAIMRSNQSNSNFNTRFIVSRSARPVATVLIPRSAFRLGETIHLIIDFSSLSPTTRRPSNAADVPAPKTRIPVQAVLVTLESAEHIDSAIAMRSGPSIFRYTRKIHAQACESALFARRLAFALAVPPTATPEFETSGIGLQWRIRVEFVHPRLRAERPPPDPDAEESEELAAEEDEYWEEREWPDLLEEVSSDDRGRILQGIETCLVETFEMNVPVRIYGAAVGSKGDGDVDDLAV